MKKHLLLYFLLIMLLCSSCYSSWIGFSGDRLMMIQHGMTQSEVKKILGEPTFRRFDQVVEEWEFRKVAVGGWSVAVIRFANGEVVGLESFLDQSSVHRESDYNNTTGVHGH